MSFFFQRVQLELQERSILHKLNDNDLNDFFLDFWKIDSSLPKELIVKLSAMLPFVKGIVGDFKMTANCLSAILEEEVTHSIHYSSKSHVENGNMVSDDVCSLGEATIGVNFITGGILTESCKIVRFKIDPLKKTGIEPYLKNGDIARFISCFCSYFIPLEIDAEFEVIMPEEMQGFVLGYDKTGAIMGYSTVI